MKRNLIFNTVIFFMLTLAFVFTGVSQAAYEKAPNPSGTNQCETNSDDDNIARRRIRRRSDSKKKSSKKKSKKKSNKTQKDSDILTTRKKEPIPPAPQGNPLPLKSENKVVEIQDDPRMNYVVVTSDKPALYEAESAGTLTIGMRSFLPSNVSGKLPFILKLSLDGKPKSRLKVRSKPSGHDFVPHVVGFIPSRLAKKVLKLPPGKHKIRIDIIPGAVEKLIVSVYFKPEAGYQGDVPLVAAPAPEEKQRPQKTEEPKTKDEAKPKKKKDDTPSWAKQLDDEGYKETKDAKEDKEEDDFASAFDEPGSTEEESDDIPDFGSEDEADFGGGHKDRYFSAGLNLLGIMSSSGIGSISGGGTAEFRWMIPRIRETLSLGLEAGFVPFRQSISVPGSGTEYSAEIAVNAIPILFKVGYRFLPSFFVKPFIEVAGGLSLYMFNLDFMESSSETKITYCLSGRAGIEMDVGPGAIMLGGGYLFSPANFERMENYNINGITLNAGYRFMF